MTNILLECTIILSKVHSVIYRRASPKAFDSSRPGCLRMESWRTVWQKGIFDIEYQWNIKICDEKNELIGLHLVDTQAWGCRRPCLTPTPKPKAPNSPKASCILTTTPWSIARRTSSCDDQIYLQGCFRRHSLEPSTKLPMRRQHKLFPAP